MFSQAHADGAIHVLQGSLIRTEATGYGLIYYVQHMIAT
jgi:glutamate dehydrogenase/leucine dehydrogenase